MAQYETVCVIKPDIQGDRLEKITDKVKKVLSDFKASEPNQQDWGIRKLAYPISKHKTAHYLCFHFEGNGGGLVAELERQFSYDDAILRYLTIKVGKHDRKDLKPEPFQFGKIEAESYSHPFGGGYDRRGGRGGFDRRDHRDTRDSRDHQHQAETKKEEN